MIGFAAATQEIRSPARRARLDLGAEDAAARGDDADRDDAARRPGPFGPGASCRRVRKDPPYRRASAPPSGKSDRTRPANAAAPAPAGFQRAQVNRRPAARPSSTIRSRPATPTAARRRLPDQRQREQRRGVAVRAARGVRQQPPQRALALQRRHRRAVRQLRARRAAVFLHRSADADAVVQRHADRRLVRRAAENPEPDHAERAQPVPRLPADARSQRQHAVGADADACSSAPATFRRRATRSDGRSSCSIRRPAVRSRQRDSRRPAQPAGGVAAQLLSAAEPRRRRPLQLPGAGARDQAPGRGPGRASRSRCRAARISSSATWRCSARRPTPATCSGSPTRAARRASTRR